MFYKIAPSFIAAKLREGRVLLASLVLSEHSLHVLDVTLGTNTLNKLLESESSDDSWWEARLPAWESWYNLEELEEWRRKGYCK